MIFFIQLQLHYIVNAFAFLKITAIKWTIGILTIYKYIIFKSGMKSLEDKVKNHRFW